MSHKELDPRAHASSDWSCQRKSSAATSRLVPMGELLGGLQLPEDDALSDSSLLALLNQAEIELMFHGVEVSFLDKLPLRTAYRGLRQCRDTLVDLTAETKTRIDGCDSSCDTCFQLLHCRIAREILGDEWARTVSQQGINPSWDAFFSE